MTNVVDLAAYRASRQAPRLKPTPIADADQAIHLMHKALDDLVVACLAADLLLPALDGSWVDAVCQGLQVRHAREVAR